MLMRASEDRPVTSAAGLVVAIPTFILFSYLSTYAKTLMHDMERGGIEIVNIICDSRQDTEIISFGEGRSDEEKSGGTGKDRRGKDGRSGSGARS